MCRSHMHISSVWTFVGFEPNWACTSGSKTACSNKGRAKVPAPVVGDQRQPKLSKDGLWSRPITWTADAEGNTDPNK